MVSQSVVPDSFVTPWTVALQAPLCIGFPKQEYWSELLFPSPGDLPNPGIEPGLLQVDSFPTELPGKLISTVNSSFSYYQNNLTDSLL